MRKLSHKGGNKLIFLGSTVLIFTLYLVYSYNNIKGRSYIYEPVFVSLEGQLPEKTSLRLNYQTFNDPTISHPGTLISRDTLGSVTYIFKTDSSYRMSNFAIYFRALMEDEEMTISGIKISNDQGTEFSYSLLEKDLIPSGNLELYPLDNGGVRIKKIPGDTSMGSSLFFYTRTGFNGVFVKTNARELVVPSLLALLFILILAACLFYSLYPVIVRINGNGISMGAYLLALAIVLMPSGEKASNLILALAIVAGFIREFREGSIRKWTSENRGLLLVIMTLIIIYLIAFLFNRNDPSTQKLLKIKYGLPMILLAIAINTRHQHELRFQYAALISGVIISVFIHLGWTIMLIDAVELKSKIFSNPQYYMESTIFSRIHHSYLSALYLADFATLYIHRDILSLRKKEILLFSLVMIAGLLFAFSRAAILALLLILIFFILKRVLNLFMTEITRVTRFMLASALTISILAIIFVGFRADPLPPTDPVKGLSTRIELWIKAADLIKQKPITGWGPGKYEDVFEESKSLSSYNSNRWRVLNTHNQFLETAGMFGLPAGIGLVWFLLFPTGFSRQPTKYSEFIMIVAIIFITGFFFESLLNRNLGILVFGLCYGLLIKTKNTYGS
ncbi:MAG: O-antigen ligase family protein [Bacteroidales bacterium]|nr:O-antigen ligase family protein [Bacteroidales bacterium]